MTYSRIIFHCSSVLNYARIATQDDEGNEMKELIEQYYMSTIYH